MRNGITLTNLARVLTRIRHFIYTDSTVARVLLNKHGGTTYAMSIKEFFMKTTAQHPAFKMGANLEEILVDFIISDAESYEFRNAIGENLAAKLLRGCNVCTKS